MDNEFSLTKHIFNNLILFTMQKVVSPNSLKAGISGAVRPRTARAASVKVMASSRVDRFSKDDVMVRVNR